MTFTLFSVVASATVAAGLFGYVIGLGDTRTQRALEKLVAHVHRLTRHMEVLLMASAEIKALLLRIDTATNDIAEDIRGLKEKIGLGMTPEDVAEIQATAEALAVKLEGIAADTENPVPE